jgi:uncharacterized protein (DUF488 family)
MIHHIWTIGHSTRSAQEFANLLAENEISVLADVRSLPGSRKFPHFNQEMLELWVPADYIHLPGLGGRRKGSSPTEANAGWTHSSFRNYADYSLTKDFLLGLEYLEELAAYRRTAFMCSEAVPWRCHRNLISNALAYRAWNVKHIMAPGKILDHEFGRWGPTPVGNGMFVEYPAEQGVLL